MIIYSPFNATKDKGQILLFLTFISDKHIETSLHLH